jgi:Tol biopolymer transport system component
MPRYALGLAFILALASETAALGQVFVLPRRANKSRVRYFAFDWRHVDILVGLDANTLDADRVETEIVTDPERLRLRATSTVTPARTSTIGSTISADPATEERVEADHPQTMPVFTATRAQTRIVADLEAITSTRGLELGPLTGGVRLFFYEGERTAAQHAAASIEQSYRYLVQKFRYIPERTFPYILYNSYQEFLQTNLFPVQEGILGVTSTRGDLRLTLPYFGDFQYFRDVSVHEMAHQFTIQKVRSFADRADVRGDPLERMPLWFIEGLAEFYAKNGLDNEAEMLVRDILLNPDVEEGYAMLDFWADRPGSALWTYKVGQIRCVFLEETYGAGIIQLLLEKSPLMISASDDEERVNGFRGLLEKLSGDDGRIIAIKFEQWLKARAFKSYLDARQGLSDLEPLEQLSDYVDALNASPSGRMIMYRGYDLTTGQARLYLLDHRARQDDRVVVTDGVPGVESLHPVTSRTFDLTDEKLVFIAQSGGSDVVYIQSFGHAVRKIQADEREQRARSEDLRRRREDPNAKPDEEAEKRALWEASIDLGSRTGYRLRDKGLFAAYSPAISPDGSRIAFVGLDETGRRDVYVLVPGEDDEYELIRLTDDEYAERDVAWGPGGVVYTSDATGHKQHNLFRIDPDRSKRVERLTDEPRDHFDPEVTSDGRIFFSAYEGGAANVYEALPQGLIRRTDVVTGLFALSPGPEGGLWALLHHSGRRRVVHIPKKTLTLAEVRAKHPETASPWQLPSSPLDAALAYDPLTIRNWELGTIFGFLGAGSAGVFGQIIATANDRLHNHQVILLLFMQGSLELTDGLLIYLNQERRIDWGFGPFQSLTLRRDVSVPQLRQYRFYSFERFFGGQGLVRYPFNRYFYTQATISVGGTNYVLPEQDRQFLLQPKLDPTTQMQDNTNYLPLWEQTNAGTRFQVEGSLSFGYDTIHYHPATGPVAGNSVLLEGTLAVQPFESEEFGTVRLDVEQYFPIIGRSNLLFRFGAGTTYGGSFARQFQLSSFDTLRGVPFGNETFLIGRMFLHSTAEFQVPLNLLIRLLIFTDIEGIAGFDFGAVSDEYNTFFDKRVLDFVLGFNLGLGPLVFRLHFAKPINIGSKAGLPNVDGSWVTNFSLGWVYY